MAATAESRRPPQGFLNDGHRDDGTANFQGYDRQFRPVSTWTMPNSRIVFIVTGSIAAFKAAQAVSRLVQDGHTVRVVASPSALRFVGSATFEGLTSHPVLSDLWEPGRAMDHIHLSRWADLGVICPATANTIASMAYGLADDLIGALALAWPRGKPLHVFPAMNREMLQHPSTVANLEALARTGVVVHPTAGGNLACGEVGGGRLLEPDDIVARIAPARLGRILVTAGATREPIDGIRFVSNVSTGRTGAAIADRLTAKGWEVTFVHGQASALPQAQATRLAYGSFADLEATLQRELGAQHYHAVIHAAAVSDYSVASVNGGRPDGQAKLGSGDALELRFTPNHKILPRIRGYSANQSVQVIGFKLTLNQSPTRTEEIARGLLSDTVDAIVANDWSRIEGNAHPGQLVASDSAADFANIDELGELLHRRLLQTVADGATPVG